MPFGEPPRYKDYREGQPCWWGRRPTGYYLRARTTGSQSSLLEEEFVPLELINTIWERGYPGVTPITRQLLNHWNNRDVGAHGRAPLLFSCQREAAETLIWLVEASPAERQDITIPKDDGLTRYACKMATGTGKTVVMGMVISWQVLSKLANPQDRRFSDAVLMVCSNLTICEGLQVLLPWRKHSCYETLAITTQ